MAGGFVEAEPFDSPITGRPLLAFGLVNEARPMGLQFSLLRIRLVDGFPSRQRGCDTGGGIAARTAWDMMTGNGHW